MKCAVKVVETLTRTVIVEAEDIDEALEKAKHAYENCDIYLNADNANVDVDFSSDMNEYKELFTEAEMIRMPVDVK